MKELLLIAVLFLFGYLGYTHLTKEEPKPSPYPTGTKEMYDELVQLRNNPQPTHEGLVKEVVTFKVPRTLSTVTVEINICTKYFAFVQIKDMDFYERDLTVEVNTTQHYLGSYNIEYNVIASDAMFPLLQEEQDSLRAAITREGIKTAELRISRLGNVELPTIKALVEGAGWKLKINPELGNQHMEKLNLFR